MQNVGSLDRIVRAVIGLLLIVLPLLLSGSLFSAAWLFWTSLVVGGILLATSAVSFCPIYAALGINSRPRIRG